MFDISVLSRCSLIYDPPLERPFNGDFNGVCYIFGVCIPGILIAFKKNSHGRSRGFRGPQSVKGHIRVSSFWIKRGYGLKCTNYGFKSHIHVLSKRIKDGYGSKYASHAFKSHIRVLSK